MVLPGVGGYSATKSALNMLSAVARKELAPDGIVVSIVYPAVTATEFHQSLAAGARVDGNSWAAKAKPAESVAEAIVGVIQSGDEEILLTQNWDQGTRDHRDPSQHNGAPDGHSPEVQGCAPLGPARPVSGKTQPNL